MKLNKILTFFLATLFLFNCSKTKPSYGSEDGELYNLFESTTGMKFTFEDGPISLPPAQSMIVDITQPELLFKLESSKYHFSHLLSKEQFDNPKRYQSNKEFYQNSPWYNQIATSLEKELDAIDANGNYSTRAINDIPRLFDKEWLSSADADYDLVAIVNRIDRKDFSEKKTCGELRFLYRLSYFKKNSEPKVFSRIPFVFNVVYEVPSPANAQSCDSVAQKWMVPKTFANSEEYVNWLMQKNSFLDLDQLKFKQVELNFQSVRLTAGAKPDMGGHAEYLMRIYAPNASQKMELVPLENSIDLELMKNPEMKNRLKFFLEKNIAAIDQGTVVVPQEFLAKKVTSFTTFGLNRTINRPYSKVFKPSEFSPQLFQNTKFLKSSEAMLLRLDDMTCGGCHQGNSVAGFHVLGLDRPSKTHPLNALRVPFSPHFASERLRRKSYNTKLVTHQIPDTFRPLSFQPHASLQVAPGSRCFVNADSHLKKSWQCDNVGGPASCQNIFANPSMNLQVGMCVSSQPVAGDPCLKGTITSHPSDPRKDVFKSENFNCTSPNSTDGYACLKSFQGVPGGLCYRRCKEGNIAHNPGYELCAYNGSSSFDECAESGNFAKCLFQGISRGERAACDENTPCRDDYICQKFFTIHENEVRVASEKRGYCVPTYFIFQMRLDGHPRAK